MDGIREADTLKGKRIRFWRDFQWLWIGNRALPVYNKSAKNLQGEVKFLTGGILRDPGSPG